MALMTGSLVRRWPRIADWLPAVKRPEQGTIVLTQRRVYIVPTRLGWMFAATLVVLLLGSINYVLSLGFALTFLLAGLGLAGMVHTTRNMAQMTITAGRGEPTFAGEHAAFHLHLENPTDRDRPSILVQHVSSGARSVLDIAARAAAEVSLAVPAAERGWLPLGRVMLETRFPLGLFRAWSYVEPDARCLVYPRPEFSPLPNAGSDDSSGAGRTRAAGSDDFSGLRAYQASDSPRHVAWKAVARGTDMLTKQFSGEARSSLWLDWRLLPDRLDAERKLARLAGWVLAAERAGARYGLRLPGSEIPAGCGDEHRTACLRALALHDKR
jgi:uncharacterized protein (DUF58 family)